MIREHDYSMKDGLTITEEGDKYYYLNGLLHREDGPAVEYHFNDEQWTNQDEYDTFGSQIRTHKAWYSHGEYHRIGGPAIEWADGTNSWFVNGKKHRLDGPAIETFDGRKLWYVDDVLIHCKDQEEFERLLKMRAFW